jgi:hypothetical protein
VKWNNDEGGTLGCMGKSVISCYFVMFFIGAYQVFELFLYFRRFLIDNFTVLPVALYFRTGDRSNKCRRRGLRPCCHELPGSQENDHVGEQFVSSLLEIDTYGQSKGGLVVLPSCSSIWCSLPRFNRRQIMQSLSRPTLCLEEK